MLSAVADTRRRHENIRFHPEKAVLLLLDLQEYFLREDSHAYVPSAKAILPGIARLSNVFRKSGFPVVATRHLNTPEDAGMMAKWWRDIINPSFAHSHSIAFENLKNSLSITKSQYDAFLNTGLEEILCQKGIEQVVVCGVMTHLCCETTARSAFMRGFEVFFTVDGTATYNESLHRASLLTLSHGFALPVLIEELLQQMESDET